MPTPIQQLVSGLGGAIGSAFRAPENQLVFVEYSGNLSRLNLFPAATIVSSGTAVLKGTFTFDLDTGVEGGPPPAADIWWDQMTAVARQMSPQGAAKLVNLGVVDFNSINANGLQSLSYQTTPIPGNSDPTNKLVNGDVFAVLTNQSNYSKVQVVAYGYNMTIQWVTYHLAAAYAVLGTGYNQPEDVKVSVDDLHAYVTERTGDLVRVLLTSANRAAATVVATGMTSPQQLFLDEAHQAAYTVEYASPGNLWQINILTGAKTSLVSNLDHPIGLVLSADLQYAYVSEQTSGPDLGRVSCIQLSNGARTTLAKGLTAPFYLTWADAGQTTLLVAERDPANSIVSINVTNNNYTVVATGVANRPSSVAIASPGMMLICCDQVIEELAFGLSGLQSSGPLLIGIGFIPFTAIQPSGLATTAAGYFYPVTNVPFGGTLPLMINYQRAANDGCAYYRVVVDGVLRSDSWSDYLWNGTTYVLQTIGPQNISGQPDYYPVHPISQLFLWMNPTLGMLMDSTNLSNGLHTIVVEFFSGTGVFLESSTPLTIMVNNQSCVATLSAPVVGGVPADTVCGLLHYGTNKNLVATMAFTASQPANYATFSFELVKGVNPVVLPVVPPTGGPVTAAVSPFTGTVSNLLGTCTIAGFAEDLYVAATINNGWSRQSQYDAQALIAFVLAP
jgi:hypothetical protein